MQQITSNLNLCGVYLITNTVNGNRYIGSSNNIRKRLWKHRALLRNNKHENAHLQNAWNKYGEKRFIYSILEICKLEEQFQREQFYIDTLKPEYNIVPEVNNSKLSEESKIKMSKSRLEGFKKGTIKVTHNTPVYVYNNNGEFVGYWESIAKATKALNIDRECARKVLKGIYTQIKGYKLFTEKQETVEPFKKPTNKSYDKRKTYIVQSDEETLTFHGMQEMADYFGISIKSLRQYTTGKHKFKRKYMITSQTAVS